MQIERCTLVYFIFMDIFPEYSHHHDFCLQQQLQPLWECSSARTNRFSIYQANGLLTISSELAIESKGSSESKNAGFFSWILTTFFISRSTRFWDFSRWEARFSLLNGVELEYDYFLLSRIMVFTHLANLLVFSVRSSLFFKTLSCSSCDSKRPIVCINSLSTRLIRSFSIESEIVLVLPSTDDATDSASQSILWARLKQKLSEDTLVSFTYCGEFHIPP